MAAVYPSVTRRRVLATLAAMAFVGPGSAAASPPVLQDTMADLHAGRLVKYFRHGATTWSGVDRLEWPRERQPLLSDEGVAQSETIGAAFRALDLPVGEVLASPFARCRDMAEFAFGRVEEVRALIGLLGDRSGRDERIGYLRTQVSRPTGALGNRILVSHRSSIAAAADIALGEGDSVLIRPFAGGRFARLETLSPCEWSRLSAVSAHGTSEVIS